MSLSNMNISLIQKIELFAKSKYPHYVNGGAFERLAMDNGFKADNAGRRCRELETGKVWRPDGTYRIIRKALEKNPFPKGRSVEYRWIPDDAGQNAVEKISMINPFKPKPQTQPLLL